MNWQFPVHITGTRATISLLLKQGKKCNQNRRKLYSVNSFPVMNTGISLCTNSTLLFPCKGLQCYLPKSGERAWGRLPPTLPPGSNGPELRLKDQCIITHVRVNDRHLQCHGFKCLYTLHQLAMLTLVNSF